MKQTDDSPKQLLGRPKDRAIMALLQYGTKEKAAHEAGIHPATLLRWSKQPKFQEALRQARREAFSQCTGRLQQAAPAAVATLQRLIVDPQTPASSKVQASRCIVELSQKSFQLEDLEARLARLERNGPDAKATTKS